MKTNKHKTASHSLLFASLVGLCFFLIVILWIPGFTVSLRDFFTAVKTESVQSKDSLQKQWGDTRQSLDQLLNKKTTSQGGALAPQSSSSLPAVVIKDKISQLLDQQVASQKDSNSGLPTLVSPDFQTFCTRNAGFHQERTHAAAFRYGVCVFSDGSECEEEMFARNKCHVGQYSVAEDGIPQKPDLTVFFDPQVCPSDTLPATGCIQKVFVENRGWRVAAKSVLSVDGTLYSVPPLAQAEKLDLSTIISKKVLASARKFIIDPNNTIQETHEENNTLSKISQ